MATEDDILSSIPDFDNDAGDSGAQSTDATTETTSDATVTETAAVAGTDSTSGGTDAPAKPATDTTAQASTRRDGLVEKPNAQNPSAKDLVDPATGQVVATGGIERRIFEGAQRVHRENAQLQQRVTQAEQRLATTTELTRTAETLKLAPQDSVQALTLMSQFLADPVRVLEALVVEVKSKGYAIPFLESGVTPGMDTAAIQRMVDAKMAPITNQQQAASQQQELVSNARATLDGFLDQHPEGQHNLETLAEMIKGEPSLSLDQAYVKLIKWSAANGFDYSQPLKPQVEAKRNAQQPAANTAQTTAPTRSAPLPNGRPTNNAAPVEERVVFDENADWMSIIRQAAKESGYRV